VLQEFLALTAWYAFVACLIYLLVIFAVMATTAVLAALENRFRARETRLEDFDTLLASPFTIPVSIVVPAYNEETAIKAVVLSLLAVDYPEYEVIVVDDGSTDATLARLREHFGLQTTGTFYRRTIATSPVTHVFSSPREPRLTVVSKTNGGKADALNCGVNVARYRYVCCVDGDTMYEPDALLKGMRLVVQDPARVIGVTSRVGVGSQPERLGGVNGTRSRIDWNPLVVFQSFDYLRAFVNVRSAWSRANYMLCASGAFAIWRRDVLLQLGGFSPLFSCEDLEFTFRAHEHFRAARIPYRILSLADAVGVTEAPTNISGLVRQRARWQRVINETVWHYRRMMCNPKYGTVGLIGMPYYFVAEVLAPLFQLAAVLSIPLAAAGGLLQWGELGRMVVIIALGLAMFTSVAVMVHDQITRPFQPRDLAYMLLLAPAELFLYRPIIFYAHWKGTIDFLRGNRTWDKFERNVR
jgi:cellulose synthase/poly-beta-1,6-N-acetylglucosamine synthase-like glycosyltransferase